MRDETYDLAARACVNLIDTVKAVQRDTEELVAGDDHIELIRHLVKVRSVTEQIKEARKALTELEERLNREYVPESMRSHGVRTITVEGVGRVSLSNRWSCSMLDKGLGMDWLRNSGNGGLIQETVNSMTLAAFAKSLNDEKGIELPKDLFNTSIMTVTSITKA